MDTNEAEEWRVIPSYTAYAASNLGRIKRIQAAKGARVGHILSANPNADGYPTVSLHTHDKRYTRMVHVLVAEAFLGPKQSGQEVNHIDSDRSNCLASNLEYLTRLENVRHSFLATGGTRGTKSGNAIINEDIVRNIRRLYSDGIGTTAISRMLGLKVCTVDAVARRKNWAWLD